MADELPGSLWRLAKTADLKKHTLALQLQTTHILSAQDSLDVRECTLQDIKAQRNWLTSERLSLLKQLELVNMDLRTAEEVEEKILSEVASYRNKVSSLTEHHRPTMQLVNSLRMELSLAPLRSLQAIFDEKSSKYLEERRLGHQKRSADIASALTDPIPLSLSGSTTNLTNGSTSAMAKKRPAQEELTADGAVASARKRGRPKGSKNKPKPGASNSDSGAGAETTLGTGVAGSGEN